MCWLLTIGNAVAVRFDDEFIWQETVSDQTSSLIVQIKSKSIGCVKKGQNTRP